MVESRKGAEPGPTGSRWFPFPAHQTRRADFPHRAFRLISPQHPRRRSDSEHRATTLRNTSFALRQQLDGEPSELQRLSDFRQWPLRRSFSSAPEARALSSADITRPQRSYDPLRLPSWPPPYRWCWRGDLHHTRISRNYPVHRSDMPRSLPRRIEQVYMSMSSPSVLPSPVIGRVGIRDFAFEACSSFTSRCGLSNCCPPNSGHLSRGSGPAGYPTKPLGSYHAHRQLHGWNLPPLANCAFAAHR